MKKYWPAIVLATITLLALVLRTYKVGVNPPALSWDEVSIGYNAYGILKTGRDEHGKFMPLDTFVAYGDYKPPLSVYLTVPFVAVLGLNETAVRLPSALAGTVAVWLSYLLVSLLLQYKKRDATTVSGMPDTRIVALLTAFLLAVSPWHINLSRAGFEANIALTLVMAGAVLMLAARRKPALWTVAFMPFVAAIYTFNSARYFSPFLVLGLFAFMFRDLWTERKRVILGGLLAAILLIPIIPHLLSPEARLRFAEVNIFSDVNIVKTANERMAHTNALGKIVNNRRVGYAREYLKHFADHFQPSFLFVSGDGNPKFSVQDVGQLYLTDSLFLGFGVLALLSLNPSAGLLLLYWMLAAIIPAATARETPHALRILDSLPTWQVFIAFAIALMGGNAWAWARKTGWKKSIVSGAGILFATVYLFNVGYYLHSYWAHYPKEYSGEWQYGYREAIGYASGVAAKYDTVYVSETIGRPYMYVLFYTRYDPAAYVREKDSSFDRSGFYHVAGFSKYRFVKSMPTTGKAGDLYIADAGSVPASAHILKTVDLLNGKPVLVVYDNR